MARPAPRAEPSRAVVVQPRDPTVAAQAEPMQSFLYVALLVLPAVALAISGVASRQSFLAVVGALAPMSGLTFFGGVAWSFSKLLAVFLALELVVRGTRARARDMPGLPWIVGLMVYAILVTVWFQAFDPIVHRQILRLSAIGFGPGQSTYRFVVQLFMMAGTWGLPVAAYLAADTTVGRDSVLRGFLWGNLLSVSFGIVQVAVQLFGGEWFSGDVAEWASGNLGARSSVLTVEVAPLGALPRLFGLGGEPKHTGGFIVLALALLIASRARLIVGRMRAAAIAVLAAGLLLTFSTSAWVAFFAVALLAMLLGASSAHRTVLRRGVAGVSVIALLATLAFGWSGSVDVVQRRVVERVGPGGGRVWEEEPKDGLALQLYAERPEVPLFGRGVGLLDFSLYELMSSDDIKIGATPTPTYFVVRALGEIGVVGVAFAFLAWLAWVRAIRGDAGHSSGRLRSQMDSLDGRSFLLLGGCTVVFVPGVVMPAFLLLAGAVLGGSSPLCSAISRSQRRVVA